MDDREKLVSIVSDTQKAFVIIFEERRDIFSKHEELYLLMRNALGYNMEMLSIAIKWIDSAYEEKNVEFLARLEIAGLTGEQLEYKHHGFSHAKKRFPRFLRPLLKWINIIIGSLASVIPLLESVKEFKESVEFVVEDD